MNKTKKTLLISSIIFIVIVLSSAVYMFSNIKEFRYRSGAYFCKINLIDEGSVRSAIWDVGISKNNTKNNIVESESNRKALDGFRKDIKNIGGKKFSLFLLVLYLIFILIIFVTAQKDDQISKSEKEKKYFPIFAALLVIFLIYKIVSCSIGLSGLYKEAIYYFSLIK